MSFTKEKVILVLESASIAAGSVLRICDEVASGRIRATAAIVRSPGHHGLQDAAMGFCIFNNVAIAANHLLEK
ncbi:Histone deacetylase, partial [Thalictrum thalictroides]